MSRQKFLEGSNGGKGGVWPVEIWPLLTGTSRFDHCWLGLLINLQIWLFLWTAVLGGAESLGRGSGTVEGSQPTSSSRSLTPSMGVLLRVA